jgi:hypothetical protein
MKRTSTCTVHTCDGCATSYIQLQDADMPNGFYVQVFEVSTGGAAAGDLYVCGVRCLLTAFKRRHDVWNHPHEEKQ